MKRILQLTLSTYLRHLGKFISKHPIYFIILPCIITAFLGTGLSVIKYERDIEKLARYEEGRAYKDKRLIQTMFPINTSEFVDLRRLVDLLPIFMINILNKKEGNILQEGCLNELQLVDEMIRNVTIIYDGKTVTYEDVCGRVDGHCHDNPIIGLLPYKQLIIRKRKKIKYPADVDPLTISFRIYADNIGGVTLDDDGFIDEAKAFRLFYITDTSNATKMKAIENWIEAAVRKLNRFSFSHITVLPFGFSLLETEVKNIADSILPLTPAVVAIVGIFSSVTSMTSSLISSKPWVGMGACISAGLALVSSFGLTFHCGVPATDFIIGIPFLILGTEVDDAYVLIATWRKTDPKWPVRKRMGNSFAEAGVAITITSITNVISFCVGIMTPFYGVKYFCIHAAVALVFTYFYMITFFGGLMAVDGFREKKQLNAITFRKSKGENRETGYSNNEIATMKVFKDVIGKSLEKTPVKATVIAVFLANFAIGIYGTSHLEDGLDLQNLLTPNSATTESLNTFFRHFSNFYSILHIVIREPLNYADQDVQNSLNEMFQTFFDHPKIADSSCAISWLEYYKNVQNSPFTRFFLTGFNFTIEEDFLTALHDVFLQIPPARQFNHDIIFNKNYTKILKSRFILPMVDIRTRSEQINTVKDMWKIADESKFNVTVYSPNFPLLEQGVIIRSTVFRLIWITSLLIFVVFFAFLPSLKNASIVAFSVVSALVATLGYMAFWGVKLDIISTTVLVLSVGFSVNYPSHVACAFSLANKQSANEKMGESLYHVGLPILQGCLSTMLGASVLAIGNTYVCRTFPKLMFLISLQTVFHAMFVLPVALTIVSNYTIPLSITDLFRSRCARQKKTNQISNGTSSFP